MAILIVVVAIGSFFAGTKFQQKKSIVGSNQQMINKRAGLGQDTGRGTGNNTNNNTNAVKNQGQTPGFRQTVGEIINFDDTSITVKMADGSSKIVLISDSTTINQSVTAAKTDLEVGLRVAVNGDQNTDGSVSGKNIEINPHVATITVTPTVKQ